MRVAIASHGSFPTMTGGMERHTYNLARCLTKQNLDVDVLLPISQKEGDFPFKTHFLPWPKRPFWLWENYDYSLEVGKWLCANKPDVVLGQGFNLWGYLKKRNIPVIFHPHGLEMYGNHLRGKEKLMAIPFRQLVKYHAKNSDWTISLGGKLTEVLLNQVGARKERLREIPNAVDIFEFQTKATKKEKQILFVGRLAFNKGLDLLSAALSLCKELDFKMKIIGDGPKRGIVEGLAKCDFRVQFLNNVSEVELQNEYAQSEALVFTSRFEGMPTVILEAMASGCAILATRIGAVDVMVDSTSGILMDPTPRYIAAALKKYFSIPFSERLKIGEMGRKVVEEKFSWEKIGEQYTQLFKDVVRVN